MKNVVLMAVTAAGLIPLAPAATADGHPDLSGVWAFTIDLPPTRLKTEANGNASIKAIDRGLAAPRNAQVKGALPFTAAPSYKPEFQAKVKYLFDHESKE